MNISETFELNMRISKRMWKFVSFEAEINPTLEDPQPISYEDGHPAYRALCRTLAWAAMEECGIVRPENDKPVPK